MKKLKFFWKVLVCAINNFSDVNIPRMAAALAYYTIFAIAPMLIIIIRICSFLAIDKPAYTIYHAIKDLIGEGPALQIQSMITNAPYMAGSGFAYVISIIALVISSTGVFTEIQDSINTIWKLKAKPKKGWVKLLTNRLLSFSILIGLGFILLVSMIASAIMDKLSAGLSRIIPANTIYSAYLINQILTFSTTFLLFGIIFKVLPDARIRWKDVAIGSLTTAILFMLGKYGISIYLSKSTILSTYGAAGSAILILLWVYYSALILYFGAAFTQANAFQRGRNIMPNEYAVWIKQVEKKPEA